MPFSFPSSPTNGQQSTQNGRVYSWNATVSAWELVAAGSITPSDIGAAAVSHTHGASQVTEGQFDIARIPSLPASQIGSGSLDAARLPLSTTAQALAGTNAATVLTPQAMHLSRRGSGRAKFFELFTDFAVGPSGNAGTGTDGFFFGTQLVGSGTSANLFSNTSGSAISSGRPVAGLLTLSTGSTSTGVAGMDSFNQTGIVRFDQGTTEYEALIYIPLLASEAEDYVIRLGCVGGSFTDLSNICFEYNRALSPNWVGLQMGISTTRLNTNVAVEQAKWITLRMSWTNSSATFSVNGTSVTTNSVTVEGSGPTKLGMHIIKTAGTTARTVVFDYVWFRQDFNTDRTFS
jgi:hypothetical protein